MRRHPTAAGRPAAAAALTLAVGLVAGSAVPVGYLAAASGAMVLPVVILGADGTVPTDNPFYDGAGPHVDSIWAYGLRNPYRAYYDAYVRRRLIHETELEAQAMERLRAAATKPGANAR